MHKEAQDWFNNPITKWFFNVIRQRRDDMVEVVAYSAGVDQGEDCLRRGYILAYNDILDTKLEEVEDVAS